MSSEPHRCVARCGHIAMKPPLLFIVLLVASQIQPVAALGVGVIVGIAIGGLAFLILWGLLVCYLGRCCCWKRNVDFNTVLPMTEAGDMQHGLHARQGMIANPVAVIGGGKQIASTEILPATPTPYQPKTSGARASTATSTPRAASNTPPIERALRESQSGKASTPASSLQPASSPTVASPKPIDIAMRQSQRSHQSQVPAPSSAEPGTETEFEETLKPIDIALRRATLSQHKAKAPTSATSAAATLSAPAASGDQGEMDDAYEPIESFAQPDKAKVQQHELRLESDGAYMDMKHMAPDGSEAYMNMAPRSSAPVAPLEDDAAYEEAMDAIPRSLAAQGTGFVPRDAAYQNVTPTVARSGGDPLAASTDRTAFGQWSEDKVQEWLSGIGFPDPMRLCDIDGKRLAQLDPEDLKLRGVTAIPEVLKLLQSRDALLPQDKKRKTPYTKTTILQARPADHLAAPAEAQVEESESPLDKRLLVLLGKVGLTKYIDTFVSEGVDDLETLGLYSSEDLRQLGMKSGHVKKLLKAVEEESRRRTASQSAAALLSSELDEVANATRSHAQMVHDANILLTRPNGQPWEVPHTNVHIKSHLGEGAFGSVALAEVFGLTANEPVTKVAVKQLKEGCNEQDKHDFLSEIKTMQQIGDHEHVVSLVGVCTKSEPMYLMTEYMKDGDLCSYLRDNRPGDDGVTHLRSRHLLKFMCDVADGMAFISSFKCVHRDLAARNVLVDFPRVAVADFGLARSMDDDYIYHVQTKQRRLPTKWLSPECLLYQQFTTQSDIWAFGITMWEIMMLGAVPYPGLSGADLFVMLIQKHYRMPKPVNVSSTLYDIVLSCWRSKADRRPSFAKLAEQLKELLKNPTDHIEDNDETRDAYMALPTEESKKALLERDDTYATLRVTQDSVASAAVSETPVQMPIAPARPSVRRKAPEQLPPQRPSKTPSDPDKSKKKLVRMKAHQSTDAMAGSSDVTEMVPRHYSASNTEPILPPRETDEDVVEFYGDVPSQEEQRHGEVEFYGDVPSQPPQQQQHGEVEFYGEVPASKPQLHLAGDFGHSTTEATATKADQDDFGFYGTTRARSVETRPPLLMDPSTMSASGVDPALIASDDDSDEELDSDLEEPGVVGNHNPSESDEETFDLEDLSKLDMQPDLLEDNVGEYIDVEDQQSGSRRTSTPQVAPAQAYPQEDLYVVKSEMNPSMQAPSNPGSTPTLQQPAGYLDIRGTPQDAGYLETGPTSTMPAASVAAPPLLPKVSPQVPPPLAPRRDAAQPQAPPEMQQPSSVGIFDLSTMAPPPLPQRAAELPTSQATQPVQPAPAPAPASACASGSAFPGMICVARKCCVTVTIRSRHVVVVILVLLTAYGLMLFWNRVNAVWARSCKHRFFLGGI
eukprot:m.145963 g.145963  ORF g.145963 m.145963 type:complete len:1383 (+) comp14146_c0_seq1:283-4431(+)